MATYLAAVYVGDFVRSEVRAEGKTPIRNYVHTGLSSSALSVTSAALELLETLAGPYPFGVYGTVILPIPIGFALENQTLSVHGSTSVSDWVIAHELAHQWFGNSAALEDWGDIWLNEGFATYLHYAYLADKGPTSMDTYMARARTR